MPLVDNLFAFRVLYKLVTPFKDTAAFKLGIIDEKGTLLKKLSELVTSEEREAYSILDRLVFNLKRLLVKLPGGESKLKNIAAAYFLIKEAQTHDTTDTIEESLKYLASSNITLVEETATLLEFLSLFEDAPANSTGAAVSTDAPVIRKGKGGRHFASFNVTPEVLTRFGKGKKKFSKWKDYLNMEDSSEKQIYDYAKKHPHGVLVLRSGDQMKAIRYNRHGGGRWHKHYRTKPVQMVAEDVII